MSDLSYDEILEKEVREANRKKKMWRWLFLSSVAFLVSWILFPIYLLAVNSLSSADVVNGWPKSFLPEFDMESLSFFMEYYGVLNALKNSLIAALFTMVIAIGLGTPAGYALARFDFRGKETFRMLILLTRAFPMPLLALPLAVIFINVGLDDSLFGLSLVHTALALPFSVLITSSLFLGIPVELEEAAWVLGCNRWQAFMKVVMPLALPGLTASAVFAFVISWNEVFAAAVLTVNNQTLTAFLVQSLSTSPVEVKFAGGLILILPAILFLFVVRKYLFSMWGIANR
ncbi:carbohydrate ABC transporter permease [Marinomonas pollencensis]|uniref:Carbohydrate ABC transporter membrane protein 2 (CUT1 family) n=1 Tax=Marinomonas pollencensis TaxID=491954 RepID=A0A3E0DKI5_9GAMM|nr:carbohydrate ABC transporter permease [Marinomonas pollencensis]REG83207.1 carbohydrate ABC transporter membrane protein 2 (CUT1 family) [Marinomonas pollencensis]